MRKSNLFLISLLFCCLSFVGKATIIEIFQTATICEGESYVFYNSVYTQAGTYAENVPSTTGGCDTTYYTTVVVYSTYNYTFAVNICEGESFEGVIYEEDTAFTQELSTVQGCDSIVHYEIDVLEMGGLNLEPQTVLCEGNSVTLSIGNFTTYQWSNGAGTPEIIVSEPGTYTVTVSNSGGCIAEQSTEVQLVELTAEVIAADPICFGEESGSIEIANAIGTSDVFLYSLNRETFQTEPLFQELIAGEYEVIVQDENECEYMETVELKDPLLFDVTISGGTEITLLAGESTTLAVESSEITSALIWTSNGVLSCSDCSELTIQPAETITYFLTAYNEQNCEAKDTILVEVDYNRHVFFPNAFSPNRDGTNEHFRVYSGAGVEAISSLQVFNRWGVLVYEINNANPYDESVGWDGTWNGQKADKGVYIFRADIQFTDGKTEVFHGDVLLSR